MLRGVKGWLARPVDFPEFALKLILVCGGVLAVVLQSAQSDTWWQLRAGADIWHDRTVSLIDRYSYTAPGHYWPDHEWLWQLLAYHLHAWGGMPLLALINGAAAIGAVVLSLPRLHPTRAQAVATMAALPLLSTAWSLRPQVSSLFALAMLLHLLRTRRWVAIPPVMLVWANLHGGVAYGGVVLVGLTVVAWLPSRFTRSDLRQMRTRLAVVTILSALATLATPLGWRLWSYVIASIGAARDPRIQEWSSSFHPSLPSVGFWCWAVACAALVLRARSQWTQWAFCVDATASAVLLPVAMGAIRNIPFFVLASLPLILRSLPRGEALRLRDATARGNSVVIGAAVVGAGLVALILAMPPARLGWAPMSASAATAIESCTGRTFTSYNSGGYLIWFTPSVKVFVDSREDSYPVSVIDQADLASGEDYKSVFDHYEIECAALLSGEDTAKILIDDRWTTAYDDGTWLVLNRP